MKVLARIPSPPGGRSHSDRPVLVATAVTAACLVAVGVVGTLSMRRFGAVPFSVPSWPWYHSWPSYLFWQPGVDVGAALVALPVALAAAAALVALARAAGLSRRVRLGGSLAAVAALTLAVAALAGGPAAWAAPLAFLGEYPGAVGQAPPFATLFYVLADRVWAGLDAAALATVAAGCLGLLVVAGLARDELGEEGERVAVLCWALAPVTVLYVATSADAMWAPLLAGAALAADRGLRRRSFTWTLACGGLLWLASMLTFAAALVLPFLAVRALAARAATGWGWVLRWAAATTAAVVGLAGLLQATTGYDVLAAVAAVDDFWRNAPGTGQRVWWVWIFGDLIAFAVILGFPLTAALVARLATTVRERAWGSFEAATAAALLAAACWGHTRGEVERMWQFLVPFAVVVAVRQLLRWRASPALVAAVLLGQALAIQVLFYTRW